MKYTLKTIFAIIFVSIIFFCCNIDENNDIIFPVSYSLDTSKLEISDYTCFTLENNQPIEIQKQGGLDVESFIQKSQKLELYDFGFIRKFTLIDETNAKAITQEENGASSSHNFTYTLVDGKFKIEGISNQDAFYTLSNDNSQLLFSWCSAYYLKVRGSNTFGGVVNDICMDGKTDLLSRSAAIIERYGLINGDSLAIYFTHERYHRQ